MNKQAVPYKYYGDDVRWFIGTVVDSSPPAGLEGRVRVRIQGIHSGDVNEIPQADLPWAVVMVPTTSHGVSGMGTNTMVTAGAQVFGMFADGKASQLPIVIGTLPRIEYPTQAQGAGRDDPATNLFAYNFIQQQFNGVAPTPQTETPYIEAAMFFLNNGIPFAVACAIVGVLGAGSYLEPLHDDQFGYGIGLWSGARRTRLTAFAKQFSPSFNDTHLNVQLMFVLQELRSTHAGALGKVLHMSRLTNGDGLDGVQFSDSGIVATFARAYLSPRAKEKSTEAVAVGAAKQIFDTQYYS